MQKQCNVCKQWKDISEFYSFERKPGSKSYARSQRKGINYCCKSCTADYNRAYHARQHEETMRRFYWNHYGLTQDEFDEMVRMQNGCCAICGQSFDGKPNVDHSHVENYENLSPKEKRKYVRGLLCGCCNRMIGQGHDDPDQLERGAQYIRGYSRPAKHH